MSGLAAHDVTFGYSAPDVVLRGVSVGVTPGITALLGPNGAGKTTLLRLLAGAARPQHGRLTIDDRALRSLSPPQRAARMAYVAQRPEVAAAFAVREVVALGRYALGESRSAVDRALEIMSLGTLADRAFATLSVGQQQRVALARALAQLDGHDVEGRFLLADEPFSAMDPAHERHAAGVLMDLASRGVGVLLVLHDFTLARRIAERGVLLGRDGRVAATGASDEVLTPEPLEEVFGTPFEEVATSSGRAILSRSPSESGSGGDEPI